MKRDKILKSIFATILTLSLSFQSFIPYVLADNSVSEEKSIDELSKGTADIPMDERPALPIIPEIPYEGSETDGSVYIYLTRHGQTITNVSGRSISGQGSTPLTAEGREVAYQLGVGLSDVYFKNVYSSDLMRTHETASIILTENETASKDMEIQEHKGLKELVMGSFEGYTYSELSENGIDVKIAKTMADNTKKYDELGEAEDYEQFVTRTWNSINEICQSETKNGGGNVLVVAHGMVNSSIARNISYEDARDSLQNSSIVLLEYNKGNIKLLSFNDLTYVEKGKAMIASPQNVELNLVVTGETLMDSRERFNSILDSELTEKGKQEISSLGKELGKNGFRAVYSGDLWKDVDTAEIIISESISQNLTVNYSKDLRSVSAGIFEGALNNIVPESELPAKERITAIEEADTKNLSETYDEAKNRITTNYTGICKEIYKKGGGSIIITASELTQQLASEELAGAKFDSKLKPGDVVTLIYDGNSFTVK